MTNQKDWKLVFREKFVNKGFITCPIKECGYASCGGASIEIFISQTLSEYQAKVLGVLEGMKKEDFDTGAGIIQYTEYNQALHEAAEAIKNLK